MATIAVMIVGSANARGFNKGDWFFGAHTTSLSFIHRCIDESSATDFNLRGVGGWFFADRFAIDVMTGVYYAKVNDSDGVGYFDFGAGVRYYPVGNLFARVGYNGQAKFSGGRVPSYLDAKIGYDFFLSDRIFFEPAAYYEKNILTGEENIFGLSIGFGLKF